jgi:hypothetical protein
MEILIHNTIPLSGFQFDITGVALGADACSGGLAGAAGFDVVNNEGMVMGFSFAGAELPASQGVLTNVAYTATNNVACLTNEILAVGEWAGGFYEINIGACVELDYAFGCTDSEACNYNEDADEDNGNCYYDNVECNESVSGNCEAANV